VLLIEDSDDLRDALGPDVARVDVGLLSKPVNIAELPDIIGRSGKFAC
jgi:hypothetical protein